ncbi:RNA pseudouridylate synthase domain-containing protein 2-like [Planoprotostelium fungivorum]|uniref:RNA pseudouridylate synthase domain-containing protein 2-like n=1 Tax=Planoprotostelium fungivorum TaxID=1890364 RepID=A0A2P6N8G5_9EUKA|nr:RNA pseudouridylate synthase domain-containing protein 2-like [Planoprotostelium fungivorum]
MAASVYFFQKGKRFVYPYPTELKYHSKARWFGKTLAQSFKIDFPRIPAARWDRPNIESQFTVNGDPTNSLHRIMHAHDVICHRYHQHEKFVTDKPIKVVFETEDMVALNKPSTIPIHPVAQYNHNTLNGIAKHELGFSAIFRIVICAKNSQEAQRISSKFTSRAIKKEYIARVDGHLQDRVDCTAPIFRESSRSLSNVSDDGRECQTLIEPIHYIASANQTVVRCIPTTGRTHQIRVHLQHIGHPIVNDPLYNPTYAAQIRRYIDGTDDKHYEFVHSANGREDLFVEDCEYCQKPMMAIYDEEMWLHARKYSVENDFSVESDMPEWALSVSLLRIKLEVDLVIPYKAVECRLALSLVTFDEIFVT